MSDPAMPANASWRIEFQIHNWTLPPANAYNAAIYRLSGTGSIARIGPDGRIAIEIGDHVSAREPCLLSLQGRTNVLMRIQKDVATMRFSCEMWNYDGSDYQNEVMTITELQPRGDGGGNIGEGPIRTAIGFLRVATTLLPLGGRPPTTADAGDWTELKFDGNLKDSGSHHHNASGYAVYEPTPDQGVFAYPRTAGAPSWSAWTSLRAGFPQQLDASASYSLADASSAVTCIWRQTKGPSTLIWTDQNTPRPTVAGLIFGTYGFALKVTDAGGNSAVATLDVGAVATDDKGVVVNADPNVDKIFGPMIAFGKNPWGFADERALTATKLRIAAYNAQGLNPPPWDVERAGTVSYRFDGVGGNVGGPPTKLSAAIGAADKTIAIEDASALDFAELPTRILLGSDPREEVRICGASATKGPAVLTVCYDGRGTKFSTGGQRLDAKAWPAGTNVGQMKVTGAGTRFLSVICPAGAGPGGKVVYAAGTIRLIPGSADALGRATDWNKDLVGRTIRVAATHGGAPFVFAASVNAVTAGNLLTLSRPFPRDADNGSFSYAMVQGESRNITLHYRRSTDGSDAQTFWETSGCESDTSVYLNYGHDIPGMNATVQRGMKYGYMDGYGYTSAFGPDFYGEDLANRALYYRSGWDPALQAARVFGDHYVDSPQVDGGDPGSIPLLIGGGAIGGYVAAVLDVNDPHRPAWSTLRALARKGDIGGHGCNEDDTRDAAYEEAWLTLAADYDPDPVQRARWRAGLSRLLGYDERCKGTDDSWSQGFLWNSGSVPLHMTAGSAVATGKDIPDSMCSGVASGTMEVTAGSAVATGSGFMPGAQIIVNGTRHGAPYTGFFAFHVDSQSSVTMAALWPGDSGQVTFVVEKGDAMIDIATSNDDPQLKKNWGCTWDNATQITLDRPWDGPTEDGAHLFSYGLAGYGQQPYMLGIKITQMKFASQIAGAPFAAKYAELAAGAATWIHDKGYDPVTQGLHYGRGMQACEPDTVPPRHPLFDSRTPGCNYGLNPGAVRAARVLTAEASQALRVYYESHPTPEAKAWGDRAYGSIWGNPLYTTGGVYSDSYYVKDEDSNVGLGAYKWTGFFFGMGMSHQWPAVRLGGVAAPQYRNVSLEIKQGAAAKARIWVTAPSGAVKLYPCGSASVCEVTVDDRQGSHWYTVEYLGADGKVVARSDPALIAMPGSGK